jgi:hypothetical protein
MHAPLKHGSTATRLHDDISQKAIIFIYYSVHKNPTLILTQNQWIQDTPFTHLRSVLIWFSHQCLDPLNGHLLSDFDFKWIYHLLCACNMSHPSHIPWLSHPDNILRKVQILKLLIMQFSPVSCYSLTLGSKYSPQHPTLKPPSKWYTP